MGRIKTKRRMRRWKSGKRSVIVSNRGILALRLNQAVTN
jgi:hypothetical protein